MNKAEVIKGLNMAIEGLTTLRNAISEADEAMNAPVESKTTKKSAPAKTTPVAKKEEAPVEAGSEQYNKSDLVAMKYNDFKKLAAQLGVDCKGTRDEIMARVEALGVVVDDGEGEAPVAEKKSAPAKKADKTTSKSGKPAPVGKANAKKADDDGADEFDEQAEAIASETDTADIIEALKDVGVKANKLNYKKQLASALREGKLTIDTEDGGDKGTEEAGGDEAEFDADSYFEEYDLSEANVPDNMSKARAEAVQTKVQEILDAVQNEELTSDEIIDFLQNNASQEEINLLGDEYTEDDLLKLYIEVNKHFIDDEGEVHEPGEGYVINENGFCCGQPLKFDKKTKTLMCEHCGAEYEA